MPNADNQTFDVKLVMNEINELYFIKISWTTLYFMTVSHGNNGLISAYKQYKKKSNIQTMNVLGCQFSFFIIYQKHRKPRNTNFVDFTLGIINHRFTKCCSKMSSQLLVVEYCIGWSVTRHNLWGGCSSLSSRVEEPLRNRSIRKGHGRNLRGPATLRHQYSIPKRFQPACGADGSHRQSLWTPLPDTQPIEPRLHR